MRIRTIAVVGGIGLLGVLAFLALRSSLLPASAPAPQPTNHQETVKVELRSSQNPAPSERVSQAEAELAVSNVSTDQITNGINLNPAQNEQTAYELIVAALQGDTAALERLADVTQRASSANHPDMTPDEQEELAAKLRPIWAAFDMLADEASRGNKNALGLLAKSARMPELSGLAIKSLGELAGRGSEGALNVILDPQRFGIDIPFASTVGALKPAAEHENARAIEALAAIAEQENQQPLWFMAADALGKAAETGNSTAIEALVSFSRSTNQSILNAVRAGLAAAAANQNARAIEALRNVEAR